MVHKTTETQWVNQGHDGAECKVKNQYYPKSSQRYYWRVLVWALRHQKCMDSKAWWQIKRQRDPNSLPERQLDELYQIQHWQNLDHTKIHRVSFNHQIKEVRYKTMGLRHILETKAWNLVLYWELPQIHFRKLWR